EFSRHETSQSSNLIPVDLLIDILTRVPAKSIARFRCVSKFWASSILHRQFLTLPKVILKEKTKLITAQKRKEKIARMYLSYDPMGKQFKVLCMTTTSSPYEVRDNTHQVLTLWKKTFIIFITLFRCWLLWNNMHNYRDTIPKEKIVGMYLGYDPKGKEFKVLCMTASLRYGVRDNTHRVLTLGPGKRFWRPVEPKFSLVKNRNIIGDICINGVLYFGAWFEQYSTIVCFDVGSEKFRFIYTNEDHEDSYFIPGNLTLFNYKGKLALQEDSSQDGLMFWVLEDAETHEWSKHIYELSALEKDMIRYTMFVGMTGTGEFVWSSSYNGPPHSLYLTFYNLESGTFRKVNIQGFQHRFTSIQTCLDYVEDVKWLM
ncbi:unnamed protein product, partial [Brassica oleracea var. botrytis]